MAKAKREEWFVSKLEQTLNGEKLTKGQLCQPKGGRNDHRIFGDNTHWTYRFDGDANENTCGTDGCGARFDCLGSLNRHRVQAHGPEWDARERAKVEAAKDRVERELSGETIGGHEVEKVVPGPRGPVEYIRA